MCFPSLRAFMTHSLYDSATVALLSSAAHPTWNVKDESFGKLHKTYFPRYIVVAEIMNHDKSAPLLFCLSNLT